MATVALDRPLRLGVIVGGIPLNNVFSARITRGLDQQIARASLVIPHPRPAHLVKGARIIISGGVENYQDRFVGYITDFDVSMYPGRKTVNCGDTFALLHEFYPLNPVSFASMSDEQIIVRVLQEVGIPSDLYSIQGTGKKYTNSTDPALMWPAIQSALDVITEIDKISTGYRTLVEPDGRIVRRFFAETPGETATRVYTESSNIINGSLKLSTVDPKTLVNIIGDGVQFTVNMDIDDPSIWRQNPWWKRYAQLKQEATSLDFHSAQEEAEYMFQRWARRYVTFQLSTHDDYMFGNYSTIGLVSSHLENPTQQNYWLQSQTIDIGPVAYRLTINGVSELTNQNFGNPLNPLTGEPLDISPISPVNPKPPLPPSNNDLQVSFNIVAISREKIWNTSTSSYDDKYTVTCIDTTNTFQGTITTRAWSATGAGALITSSTDSVFTTVFNAVDGTGSITLQVTNSLGNTGSLTKTITQATMPIKTRKLYVLQHSSTGLNPAFGAFAGDQWRWHEFSNVEEPTAIANAPFGAAVETNVRAPDDLISPGIEFNIGSGFAVSSYWMELDVSNQNVIAGAADGRIAISLNAGVTWEIKAGPNSQPVKSIVLSRFTPGQIHVAGPGGYYRSDNWGGSWTLIVAGDFLQIELSHTRNIGLKSDGTVIRINQNAANTAFTFPVLSPVVNVVSVTAHIRHDKFYAVDDQNRAFHQYGEANGSYTMVQGANLPAGVLAQIGSNGIWRDGLHIDEVYIAGGTGGAWKTVDGFRTTAGYLQLLAAAA